ncbi:MAG: aminotransferase [Alphaproteobacteria bacterium]|nr:aminotransferase [Alphaproteobacteria bacterium]MBV9540574.1 aminotransferase [Alphaproteobacteria bacterium]
MPQGNPIFAGQGTTIFTVMSALAVEHNAINLGQGFPDEDGPLAVREAASRSLIEGPNQYPPMKGRVELRRAIAGHAKRFYGLDFDVETEVLVTSGATEALTAAIMGLVGQGDEIVLIEPSYDCYRPIAQAVGANVKSVKLKPPRWRLTEEDLRAVIGPNTRAVLINTPLNPIGRVFDREELEALARVVKETNAVVICDEVYEHLVFDNKQIPPLIALPGMAERCVRIGSAGKMFSLTGWKVGWVTGPRALVDVVTKAHQFITFTTPTALQLGVAYGIEQQIDFTLNLTKELQSKRDKLAAGIAKLGFELLPCEGTYFLTASIAGLTNEPDTAFCQRLVKEAGVALIPLSVFFSTGKPDTMVRFAFCKKHSIIDEALGRLEKYFGKKQT